MNRANRLASVALLPMISGTRCASPRVIASTCVRGR